MMEDVMVCVVLTGMPKCAVPSRINAALVSADRKSTRLNSSHDQISYAVFCLKKKKKLTKKTTGCEKIWRRSLHRPEHFFTRDVTAQAKRPSTRFPRRSPTRPCCTTLCRR